MTEAAAPAPTDIAAWMSIFPNGMGGLNDHMGVELTYISDERIEGRIPVALNTQPYGILHGGASIALAETLASVGSAIHYSKTGGLAVGLEVNATHHRATVSGYANGVATPIHQGRTTCTYEIVITNDEGKRVCTSRITCAVVPAERYA